MRSCDLPLPKSLPQGEGLFFDSPLRVGNPTDSPSLAEGVRGWVIRLCEGATRPKQSICCHSERSEESEKIKAKHLDISLTLNMTMRK